MTQVTQIPGIEMLQATVTGAVKQYDYDYYFGLGHSEIKVIFSFGTVS